LRKKTKIDEGSVGKKEEGRRKKSDGSRKKIVWRARNPRYQALPGNAYKRGSASHFSLPFTTRQSLATRIPRLSLGTRKKTVKCIEEKDKNR
jgi:hypothetical protein